MGVRKSSVQKSAKKKTELSNYKISIHCQQWRLEVFAGQKHSLCARLQHMKSRETSPASIPWYAVALTGTFRSRATQQPPVMMKSEFVTLKANT